MISVRVMVVFAFVSFESRHDFWLSELGDAFTLTFVGLV